ncbi:MAG: protein-glutamate O-methyltransferase CheR [Gemmatimonadota bacterium]
MTEEDVELIALKRKIERNRGFKCELYKDKCLRRRLHVRMRARQIDSFGAYSVLLDREPEEYDRLIDALTINVTKFFRNRPMWESLATEVLPCVFREGTEEIRAWSAGCASGEEPYSLAIAMREWAEREGRAAELERVRILGTDIDRASIAAAEGAAYTELTLEETPPILRDRWFSSGPRFELDTAARAMVSFRRSDLLSDTPRTGQSLILCRNVVIYFERHVQERLFELFYDSLRPGGFLVLGRVETLVGSTRPRFRRVDVRERIYMKPS